MTLRERVPKVGDIQLLLPKGTQDQPARDCAMELDGAVTMAMAQRGDQPVLELDASRTRSLVSRSTRRTGERAAGFQRRGLPFPFPRVLVPQVQGPLSRASRLGTCPRNEILFPRFLPAPEDPQGRSSRSRVTVGCIYSKSGSTSQARDWQEIEKALLVGRDILDP